MFGGQKPNKMAAKQCETRLLKVREEEMKEKKDVDERPDHHKRVMIGPRCETASVASCATDAIA